MWCAADNYNNVCDIRAKGLLDLNFKLLLTKYQIFTKLTQISYNHKNVLFFFKHNWNFFRPTASSLEISWQGDDGNQLFQFCQL